MIKIIVDKDIDIRKLEYELNKLSGYLFLVSALIFMLIRSIYNMLLKIYYPDESILTFIRIIKVLDVVSIVLLVVGALVHLFTISIFTKLVRRQRISKSIKNEKNNI